MDTLTLCAPPDDQVVTWMLMFEDAGRDAEFFIGEGAEQAARARWESCRVSWSCTLYRTASVVPDEH